MRDVGAPPADWYARMGGSEQILDAYRASIIAMAGMAVAIYAVQILLRMRAEEADGRLEPVLAASVSRPRWLMSHLLNAGLGATPCCCSSSPPAWAWLPGQCSAISRRSCVR